MTTYTYSGLGIRNPAVFARTRITNSPTMRSVLTGAIQTTERAGSRWALRVEWVVPGAERDALEALLTRLNGPEHRLRLPMFGQANRGTWSGTPLVNGGSQAGYELDIDGAGASVTNYARAGDLFTFDNCVRMVTADANSDGSGQVALPIWPPIRTSPADNTAIDHSDVDGVYILVDFAELELEDVLASGELLSRIGATFEDDVLA